MEMILNVDGIWVKFDNHIVNNNLSFSACNGEILGIIGPNGAGKTTALKCITGFEKPYRGKIYYNGENIVGMPPYKICKKGIVRIFQKLPSVNDLTALENVMAGGYLHVRNKKDCLSIANSILNFVGLYEEKETPCCLLSLFRRKKLEIARVLATQPKIIVIDEGMSGLYGEEIPLMAKLYKDIQKEGITIIAVEHIMEGLLPVCDRLIVLNAGEKIIEGTVSHVLKSDIVKKIYLGENYAFN